MAKVEDLNGKVVWITGASSGIGKAIAQQCAALGAQVAPVVIVRVRPAAALGLAPRRGISDAIDSGAAAITDDAGLFHGSCLHSAHKCMQ